MARPKQPLISQQAVIKAATEILEQDGLEALSLRRLASKLNVNSASFYHHFSSKDDILMAVVRSALREMTLPPLLEKWDSWICDNAIEYRRLLIRKPFLIPLILKGVRPQTMASAVSDGKLSEIGVPDEVRPEFLLILDTAVVASALVTINTPKIGATARNHFDHEEMLRSTMRHLLRDMISEYGNGRRKGKANVAVQG